MSSQVLSQAVKILDDLRDAFHSVIDDNHGRSDEERAEQTVEYLIDVAFDTAREEDCSDLRGLSRSVVFGFDEEERKGFIEDVKNMESTEEVEAKYKRRGVTNILDLLDKPLLDYPVIVRSDGSTYRGKVLRYELKLKPDFTPRDFFWICKKFMDHDAHSVQSVKIDGEGIMVEVDEST